MKHPSDFVPLESITAPRVWQSLEEWRGDLPEVDEIDDRAPKPDTSNSKTRRDFLHLVGGSLALAGLAGCTRQPPEGILPYVEPPPEDRPGEPLYFATAVPVNGVAQGVLVESHTGRPTKVEGNPDHPASLGATDVLSQACLLDLYDPDRAVPMSHLANPATWDDFLTAILPALRQAGKSGGGVRILTETVTSPTLGAQISAFLAAYPGAKWHQYDPAGWHSARAGSQEAFGRPLNTYYRFDRADVILAVDSDFLACGPASTRYARDFAGRRRVRRGSTSMNRLYAAETTMTATGGKADHRLSLRYSELEPFLDALASAIGGASLSGMDPNRAKWISAAARDLVAHKGTSAIIPGDHTPARVHALCYHLNGVLGNNGATVIHTDPIEVKAEDQVASLRTLVTDMQSGAVQVLLILGGNPVYNAPNDFGFAQALKQVPLSVHSALLHDETSSYTHWHVPHTHFLEDWGDARSFDGTVTIQQPLISPMFDGISLIRLLDALIQPPGRSTYDIVRSYWQKKSGAGDFETWWRQSVHSGVVANSALPPVTAGSPAAAATSPAPQNAGGIEFVFRPDPYILDGRYANNPWLRELPRPMTKLSWDNPIHISIRTAQRLGLQNQERVEVSHNGASLIGSVWITPGQPDDSLTLPLGYGRYAGGKVATQGGYNAYQLRRSDAMWSATGAQVRKTGPPYPLATMQIHRDMAYREPAIVAKVSDYLKDPKFAQNKQKEPAPYNTLYPQWDYTGYSWGMSIDLTSCVNCNACVIACQAENNIPVVGKEQCLFRRQMYWIRVDTYYEGDFTAPMVRYQPVPCMHCEDAPCELVCPVQATNHSSDGLNDMVYNRCVGTRYCSNNCPYKVRRFNFLIFADWSTEEWKMQRNPDVTVRSRGVMEKCTYCVQRIREAEIRARREDRFIRDGEIVPACAQACPTQAIVFGDINNPNNQVAKLKREDLNYALLAELNTRPHTTYLAGLRNPNPELEAGA